MNNLFLTITIFGLIAALSALLYAFFAAKWCLAQKVDNPRLIEIGHSIAVGAIAFLRREYTILSIFVAAISLVLFYFNPGYLKLTGLAFILGAFLSGLAGYIGMKIATQSNFRTTAAASESLAAALKIAFKGGSVMGMSVVGLAMLGMTLLLFLMYFLMELTPVSLETIILPVISGFSLGASSIALFARVGGGIFTKAADVGADLVGKIEIGIPEDSPNNPATIADNVGDNVGDVAGMGADLFESYFGALIGSMILGATILTHSPIDQLKMILLPVILASIGILVSIAMTFTVRVKENGNPQHALDFGTIGAAILTSLLSIPVCLYFVPPTFGDNYSNLNIFWSVVIGLVAGVLIGKITEYYTGTHTKPTLAIAKSCETGAATNIISGIAIGMKSCLLPVILIVLSIILSFKCAGLYGISIAALGMLATTGIQLAVDAYGPIADNAGGIAEMAHMPPSVRQRTDKLDAVGNTTAAIGKGFAIGSAALTALALFSAFRKTSGLTSIDITDPFVMSGLFLGGVAPFIFSSLSMEAVGKAAFKMIEEVRRQFREHPGILKGTEKADYARCVDISTKAALKEMILPGLLAILTPIIVTFIGGLNMVGGLLAGVTVSGVLLALFMSNAGGAWDNAKKMIEEGLHGGKGSPAHAAAVIGDTVGDPFKDTAGPSLNILVKLMCVVSLTLAPILKNITPLLS